MHNGSDPDNIVRCTLRIDRLEESSHTWGRQVQMHAVGGDPDPLISVDLSATLPASMESPRLGDEIVVSIEHLAVRDPLQRVVH